MEKKIEEYLNEIQLTDISENTWKIYEIKLRRFQDWLDQNSIEIQDINRKKLLKFFAMLKDEGYRPKTRLLFYRVISKFLRWADIDFDLEAKEVANPKKPSEQRSYISKEKVKKLIENVPRPKLRNKLIIKLLYLTGLRVGELVEIKVDDIDFEQNEIKNIEGKRNKTFSVWFPKELGTLLKIYIKEYRGEFKYSDGPYLFPSNRNPRITKRLPHQVVTEAAERAGIQKVKGKGKYKRHEITPHVLRHSYATQFLKNGGSIEALSKNLHHESVATTEIYGEIVDDRAEKEQRKYGPRI